MDKNSRCLDKPKDDNNNTNIEEELRRRVVVVDDWLLPMVVVVEECSFDLIFLFLLLLRLILDNVYGYDTVLYIPDNVLEHFPDINHQY